MKGILYILNQAYSELALKKHFTSSVIAVTFLSCLPSMGFAMDPQPKSNTFWWPDRIDLQPLRQHESLSDPTRGQFNYAKAFANLNLQEVKADIKNALTTSKEWWPADFGHYGPFIIRMAWHSAGTYRIADGRGGAGTGQQRFEPLNSWPDNANLDKARRLLWPVKQKYGRSLSWADLMILAGNVALESMGFKTYGFAGGRVDAWEADMVYWGPENTFLDDKRYSGDRQLENPLAAVQMGLIYVNPEGPNGNPDPMAAAKDIRETFARMAMNDEETVALIAGGHTFGKAHGAHEPSKCLGKEPAAESINQQGFGWNNSCGKGNAEDTITSGLEGAWTATPTTWSSQYLDNLFAFDWVQSKSPAGATQWIPANNAASNLVPDAHVEGQRHAPIMFTTDLALKTDPSYLKIAKRFKEDPKAFEDAFAKAWFKLTHRDLGPKTRYVGAEVPLADLIWQDPLPTASKDVITDKETAQIKAKIIESGLTVPERIRTAWAAAATFRGTDKRGGVNGARINLLPQKEWEVNDPQELSRVLNILETIQADFNRKHKGKKRVSLADVIVIAGNTAIEQAAKQAGVNVKVPFKPGRTDASQTQTDIASFAVLEPLSDGFRNFVSKRSNGDPARLLIERANLLTLTVPEMTVLVGGMRALNANAGNVSYGVFTKQPGTLSNDYFVNLLDINTKWQPSSQSGLYDGVDRNSGAAKWTATDVDLMFGSHSELRAVAEYYGANDAKQTFVQDFVKAWTKVMELDRFDIA